MQNIPARIVFPALLSMLILTSCAKLEDLEYVDFQNIKMISLGLQESTVGLDIRFYNPNRQQIQMKDGAVDVFINNKFLGKSRLDSLIKIPKRDTFAIPIVIVVETLTAGTSLLNSLSDTSVLVRFEGNAKVGKGGIFVNYPIKYEGKQSVRF